MSAAALRTQEIVLPFEPRPWQSRLIYDPSKRIVAVVHRRAGKSVGLLWRLAMRMVECRRPSPRGLFLLPLSNQWTKTGLWDVAKGIARAIPGAQALEQDRVIRFPTGAIIQCGGASDPDAWRGGYADEAILDEYDDMLPTLLPLVILPMLADRDGTLVLSGTPKGRGLLKAAYDTARQPPKSGEPEWSHYRLPWNATNALDAMAISAMRAGQTPEEFAQEFECSFEAPHAGSYYGKLLDDADKDGRVRPITYDPRLPVTTAWDLGIGDSTAIWFCQQLGAEVRLIDYMEGSGVGLDWYARELQRKPYVYGEHLLPHDARARELGTGRTREETLAGLGVRARIVPMHQVDDGINAVRLLLPRMWFDRERCAKGLKMLAAYHRDFDERNSVFRLRPVHDQSSHAADAMRYLAMGIRENAVAMAPRAIDTMRSFDPHDFIRPVHDTMAGWDPHAA